MMAILKNIFCCLAVICAVMELITPDASASEPNKQEILEEMADLLFEKFEDKVDADDVPVIYLKSITNFTASLSAADVEIIGSLFEGKLSEEEYQFKAYKDANSDNFTDQAYIVHIGLSDEVSHVDKSEDHITAYAKLRVVTAKSSKNVFTAVITVAFENHTSTESYFFRDGTTGFLTTTSVVTGLTSAGFLYKGLIEHGKINDKDDSRKYSDSETKRHQDKYKKRSDESFAVAGLAAGASQSTYLLSKMIGSADRDQTQRVEYELSVRPIFIPSASGLEIAWDF